ncbi:MAG TPA: hypothetical protein VJ990_01265 [Clostridia bacterium]|nr:hypothetical protein [Clostridia bacterium]
MGDKKIIGFILLTIGIVNFASRQGWISGEYFLIGLGAVFLVAYFVRRRPIGFLIPACILLMLGFYSNIQNSGALLLSNNLEGAAFFFFMAIAFYLIFFIHNTRNESNGKRAGWAVVTGTALAAFGIFVFAAGHLDIAEWLILVDRYWPLILVAAGLYLVFSKKNKQ